MITQGHLKLRSVSLEPPEVWDCKGAGLVFIFVRAGAADYISGLVRYPVSSGDVLVASAVSGGRLHVPDQGKIVFEHFSLRLEHFLPLLANNEIYRLQNVSDVFRSARLYPASSAPAQKCRRLLRDVPSRFDLDHRSQLLRVAAVPLAVEFETVPPQPNRSVRDEKPLAGIIEKLSTAELLSLPVGGLANKFGCSRRHLNRLFHQRFGVSAAALKMEMRLLKAVSLLKNPDTKIIRVAEECGFSHLSFFNIHFKKRFGASPGQWRKLVIEVQTRQADVNLDSVNCSLRSNGLCPLSRGEAPNPRVGGAKSLRTLNECIPSGSPTPLPCGVTTLNHPKVSARPVMKLA
ncbi:MAG TPA: helix-turn-helix transcriptional regulator [Verrucomicrobiae bacterium]|nr:helix-turn-helix transcriptional regulator [Verrucomicrobiae bacterium]